jgi:competence protein ComEC
MIMVKRTLWAVAGALLMAALAAAGEKDRTLNIHFIDTEGGAATLLVTPRGESVLIDCGNPGGRDAERIHKVADQAGLKQLDHLIVTHWHTDHYGGVARLAQLLPVKNWYHHGIPEKLDEDPRNFPTLIQAYKEAAGSHARVLKAGDSVSLQQPDGQPAVSLKCVCGSGEVLPEPADAKPNPIAGEHKPKEDDPTDNARSLGFILSFGDFRFLDVGDLTWNVEYKLVHPSDKIGAVDVYQVTHHGLEISNNPVLIKTVRPRVAICNNGPTKGGHPFVISTLRRVPDVQAIYQLHRNLKSSTQENTDPEFIANNEAKCQGESIRLSVAPDAKTYTVAVGSKGVPRRYETRGIK